MAEWCGEGKKCIKKKYGPGVEGPKRGDYMGL
jgi:hypothetical protein